MTSKPRGIFRYIDEVNEVGRVGGIRGAVRIAHQLAVAMVGGDQSFAAQRKHFWNNPAAAGVDRFYGFDPGLDHAGVTYHVGIREVENDQVVVSHPGEDRFSDFERAHFRLEIVGRDLSATERSPVFPGKGVSIPPLKK